MAGAIRLQGLAAPDGRLDKDEVKLALAADGILQRGLPVFPSGRLYTRGMLISYLIAPSFVLFGRHDFAARLPSALTGMLLVPAVFLLARRPGGVAAGLAAASFVAVAEPLVAWSRSAWMPSVFLLLFTLAAYACYRGFVERQPRWQVIGAVCFCLAALSYEFAVLLAGALGLYLGIRLLRGDRSWYLGRPTLIAAGLFAVGLALFVGLGLALRLGTLAGPLSEARGYIAPSATLRGAAFYLQGLLADYRMLVAVALLGLPFLLRARVAGASYLGILLAVAFLVPSVVIGRKYEPRYALAVLPLLAIVAAGGAAWLAEAVGRRIGASAGRRALLQALVLVPILSLTLFDDASAAVRRLRTPVPGPTWLQALEREGVGPTDLVLSDAPEPMLFYLGRIDFHVYGTVEFRGSDGEGYERYSYQAPDGVRSIYTDSLLLAREGDFERLVEQPNPGRTLWVIGHEERLRRQVERVDSNLWPSLTRSARRRIEAVDDQLVLRVELPLRVRHN